MIAKVKTYGAYSYAIKLDITGIQIIQYPNVNRLIKYFNLPGILTVSKPQM